MADCCVCPADCTRPPLCPDDDAMQVCAAAGCSYCLHGCPAGGKADCCQPEIWQCPSCAEWPVPAAPCTCRTWCGHADCGAQRTGIRWWPKLAWWRLREAWNRGRAHG